MPRLEYDRGEDAVYIYLRDAPYADDTDLDDERRIDYAPDGAPRGIELLSVGHGVNLDGLPQRDVIVALLEAERLPILT